MVKNNQQKAAILGNLLEVRRAVVELADHYGLESKEMIVYLAVRMGAMDHRPMDISAIAAVTALKFSSVHRYLTHLRSIGYVQSVTEGNRVLHVPALPELPELTHLYSRLNHALLKGTKEVNDAA